MPYLVNGKKIKDCTSKELKKELTRVKGLYIKGPNERYGHLCNKIVDIHERLRD